jgi:AAHS family 4-hydroxybenzoate transporter-like MFS transporter
MFTNISTAFAVFQWLPTILNETGFALENANALVALMWASAMPGVLLLIHLAKSKRIQRVLAVFLCFGAFVTCALGASIALSATEGVWLLMIGFGVTVAGAQAGFYSLLASVYPGSSRVTGIGWAQGVGRLGGIVGPSAVGILLSADTSILALFFYLAIPVVISAMAVWNVRLPHSVA